MLSQRNQNPPQLQVAKTNEDDIKKAEQELNDAMANAIKAEQTLRSTPSTQVLYLDYCCVANSKVQWPRAQG
jgi:hypothetical protein